MSNSVTIYLDKLPPNELHIFYNKDAYSFEVKVKENIDFFSSQLQAFPSKKSFIEDTKEEFKKNGRSSDDLQASVLNITDNRYLPIVRSIESQLLKVNKDFPETFQKDRRMAVSYLSELLNLFNFLTRYEDLLKDKDYADYAYYVLQDEDL